MEQDWVAWPEETAAEYRRAGYWRDQALDELLREGARRHGTRTALVSPAGRLDYAGLDGRVDRLAAGLAALPLHPGERVLVQLPNREEYVTVCFALLCLGAVPILALPSLGRSELVALARLSGAAAHVVAAGRGRRDPRPLADEVARACPTLRHVLVAGEPGADHRRGLADLEASGAPPADARRGRAEDPALLLLSGGTTGTPSSSPAPTPTTATTRGPRPRCADCTAVRSTSRSSRPRTTSPWSRRGSSAPSPRAARSCCAPTPVPRPRSPSSRPSG